MARGQIYKDKLAVITGGGSGLGLALAHELKAHGATPVLIDIQDQQTPFPLESADVSDADALSAVIKRIEQTHGPIALAIANAAIDTTGEAHQFTAEDWRTILETNLIGATNLVSAVYPQMIERASGQLMLVASGAGLIGFPFGAPYTASKAGLIGLGHALRTEGKQYGVSVCTACPPSLDTPLLKTGNAKAGINRQAFLSSLQKHPMSAQTAARYILTRAQADKSPIVFPANLRLGQKLATLFPKLGEKIRADIAEKFDEFGRR
jgi:NAD(P)-dependent dehydrogenase (short-subunit alcohol dehydrogenase family)